MIEALNQSIQAFTAGSEYAVKGMTCPLPDLIVFESAEQTALEPSLSVPIACLTLQGEKETVSAHRIRRVKAGETITFSHAMPVSSRVTKASKTRPYRALVLLLDMSILRSLYEQLDELSFDARAQSAVEVYKSEPAFVEAMARYFDLVNDPVEARVMAPLIRKELHYRLLVAPNAGILRRLLHVESHASRVGKAISFIREHFREAIPVSRLADIAGMSASSLHAHFRGITETTPLQFQKDLKLLEAHRLLSSKQHNVTTAAFAVGYESASQFSREYSRKFGISPSSNRMHGSISSA